MKYVSYLSIIVTLILGTTTFAGSRDYVVKKNEFRETFINRQLPYGVPIVLSGKWTDRQVKRLSLLIKGIIQSNGGVRTGLTSSYVNTIVFELGDHLVSARDPLNERIELSVATADASKATGIAGILIHTLQIPMAETDDLLLRALLRPMVEKIYGHSLYCDMALSG